VKFRTIFLLLIAFFCFPYGVLGQEKVTPSIDKISYPKYGYYSDYYIKVLDLVLEKTRDEYGDFQLIPYDVPASTERLRRYLEAGTGVSVLWSTSNKDRDERLFPIEFNLLKGLNRYRFLLVRKGEKKQFMNVKSLADLRQFRAGSGVHWRDTELFRANNLPTVTSINNNLLPMLSAKRFDYLARGAYEIGNEMEDWPGRFELVDSVVLTYSSNYYFYVNNKNSRLADRLRKGLAMASEDGSYDRLFFSIPSFKYGWNLLYSKSYRVLNLPAAHTD
jgi:hypothetical protein